MDEAHNHIERIAHLTSENVSSQSGHFDAMYKVIFVGDAGTYPLPQLYLYLTICYIYRQWKIISNQATRVELVFGGYGHDWRRI